MSILKKVLQSVFFLFIIIFFSTTNLFSKDFKANENSDTTALNLLGKENKINLVMIPKIGDIFKYKMTAQTKTDEETDAEDFPEEDADQTITYYYAEEVFTINKNIITYKITFDSIMVSINSKTNDQILNIDFNSNVQNSFYHDAEFIQYISIINESFFIRVTTKGEIEEVYGLENVYNKMFKAFGDTLDNEEKMLIKESFGNDAVKSVLQQQFQILPEKEISKIDLK